MNLLGSFGASVFSAPLKGPAGLSPGWASGSERIPQSKALAPGSVPLPAGQEG